MKSSRAFTLIELLIVIAIIGILMSLLFPAVSAAIDSARKAQAKNDVTQIATAVIAYETEYGRLPGTNETGAQISSDVLGALMGSNTASAPNPRSIVFLEVNTAKKGKSGVTNGVFVDPWGVGYKIAFDGNYDNSIPTVGEGAPYNTTTAPLRKKVAVWNIPPGNNAGQQKRRAVTSWD
jgi:prepilin-type N-terminal cleavage/methylation domain-containing protein